MALALWFILDWTRSAGMARLPELTILVFGGAAIYFTLAFATGAYRLSDIRAATRR